MAIKKEVKLKFWDKIYLPAVIKGMGITISHFFKTLFTPPSKRYTIEYPDRRKEDIPEWYRGLHRLNTYPDGTLKCVACFCCATACPADAIYIEPEDLEDFDKEHPKEKAPKVFQIDLHRCIYCGFCEEACPKDAIVLTNHYEIVHTSREAGIIGIEELVKTKREGGE
ncbi:NADH-quinone oxidoreductase subunit I [Thermotomaculum hydrothermale]|uniref:NADH-quinone oxidoreductase subunit I n=1 Tax=Thermotomaculum hydrothermale TaxID=981385 RepID=A0A7R6SZE7_9BACT|nr:NADH-quinone oxidoreductase subunit I [Thermotomaculum hydrothermale]BBB32775.1 NADH-quinone oxidoreductase subunit I [Thermotomaculum hydrothermale]